MNKSFNKRRLISILLSISILIGISPVSAVSTTSENIKTPNFSVDVSYPTTERQNAQIHLKHDGLASNPFNIIFLVDSSKQGKDAYDNFKTMIDNYGANALYSGNNQFKLDLIKYNSSAEIYDDIQSPEVFTGYLHEKSGEGVADETVALSEAIKRFDALKSNGNPTAIFWVLGSNFGVNDTAKIEKELEELTSKMSDKDALITFQYSAEANTLLEKYTTKYNDSLSSAMRNASYYEDEPILFQNTSASILENMIYDHFYGMNLSLELNNSQSLVKNIENVTCESSSTQASLRAKNYGNKVDFSIDKLRSNAGLDINLDLILDVSVNDHQTVINQAESQFDSQYKNSGLSYGWFDENTLTDKTFITPPIEIDRVIHKITYDIGQGNGKAPEPIQKMSGEIVKLDSGNDITNNGKAFGGWNFYDNGKVIHYQAGEIIKMPDKDLALNAAWGGIELELEIGKVEEPEAVGNRMVNIAEAIKRLDFTTADMESPKITQQDIISVTVNSDEITYSKDPKAKDENHVQISNGAIGNVVYARHLGATDDDKVVAYLVQNSSNPQKYDMYISAPNGVKAPSSCEYLFGTKSDGWQAYVKTLDISGLDTSDVTDMDYMFANCTSLTSLKAPINTSNVERMIGTFQNCNSLTSLDLSSFDTNNVESMSGLFHSCNKIQSIKLGDTFNTSKVSDMSTMFYDCNALTDVDLSGFDTSSVTDMSSMFQGCTYLADNKFKAVEQFNVANVTDFSSMFSGCTTITNLNLEKWNTKSATNLSNMFSGCNVLTTLNLSGIKTDSVTDISSMFSSCRSLANIIGIEAFNTQNVTNMSGLFTYCKALTTINIKDWNTSSVTDMSSMFNRCFKLSKIDLSGWDTSKVQAMNNMFTYCEALESLNISSFNTENTKNLSSMFENCKKLSQLDISNFNTSNISDLSNMFKNCQVLTTINIGDNFNISNAEKVESLFNGCSNLSTITGDIKLGATNTAESFLSMFQDCSKLENISITKTSDTASFPNLNSMAHMFARCNALKSVDLSGFVLPNLTSTEQMFFQCGAITNIDISWSSIKSQPNDFNVNQMFEGANKDLQLEVGTDQTENTQAVMEKIKEVLKGWIDQGKQESVNSTSDDTSDSDDTPIIPDIDENKPVDDTTDTTEQDKANIPQILPIYPADSEYMPAIPRYASILSGDIKSSNITVHPTPTKPGSKILYRIRVKYTGDVGVQSGQIQVKFPLPDDVSQDPTDTKISVSPVTDTGEPTGFMGGRVVKQPEINGGILSVTLEGLYTGNQMEINIVCTNNPTDNVTEDNTMYWDAIAYASDSTSTATSNILRLWNGNALPSENGYRLSYAFAGNIPNDAIIPVSSLHKQSDTVTSANQPITASGYTFDGWYRSDDNKKVNPSEQFNMPNTDLILTGMWTRTDNGKAITINYEYSDDSVSSSYIPTIGDVNSGAMIPAQTKIFAGDNYSIVSLENNIAGNSFSGWIPTLKIDNSPVELTTNDNGKTYQDSGKNYLFDMQSGNLHTEQFYDKNAEITFTGKWSENSGTIHFNRNGADTGSMDDMQNITFSTKQTLTPNGFSFSDGTRTFMGWSKYPNGEVIKQDSDSASGLITQDKQVVTLYAQWQKSNYDIGYKLESVTAENQVKSVAHNQPYTNKLTANSGKQIKSVYVTMNYRDITNSVYDDSTGNINIPNVIGDIMITARAEDKNSGSGGNGSGGNENYKPHSINISVNGNGEVKSSHTKASYGTNIYIYTSGNLKEITAYDDNSNKINLSGDGKGGFAFSMPDSDVNIVVSFNNQSYIVDPNISGIADMLNTKDHIAYIIGNPDGNFYPSNNITRAEISAIFYRLLLDQKYNNTSSFNDVSNTDWFYNEVSALATKGIIKGYEDNSFRPNSPITRAEFAVMATRFAKPSNKPEQTVFSDVDYNSWYADAVKTASSYGWINGYGDGTFQPNSPILRSEAVKMINYMLARIADENSINNGKGNRFGDVLNTHWAFYEITEASTKHTYTRPSYTSSETWQ